MTEEAKIRMRLHFLHGMKASEIAERDDMSVSAVLNAIGRVREKLSTLAAPAVPKQGKREAVIVRVRTEDLERVLATASRMEEQTKERMRSYFVGGMSMPEIAARDHVSIETVANAVRRVRSALEEQASPWQFVDVTVTLPVTLAQELQALANGLGRVRRRRDAEALLEPVLKAVIKSRKQMEPGT